MSNTSCGRCWRWFRAWERELRAWEEGTERSWGGGGSTEGRLGNGHWQELGKRKGGEHCSGGLRVPEEVGERSTALGGF